MTKEINPLIGSPGGRDFEEFRNNLETIPCDKLLVKYHHPVRAYKLIRSYFLDHKQYTHLIIHPDDLVVNHVQFNMLKKNVQTHDFQVLSGICVVEVTDNHLAMDINNLPNPIRRARKYNFAQSEDRNDINGIIRVKWVGTPFMWISRKVLEQIELEDDTRFNPDNPPNQGWAFDVMFCYNCSKKNIPIYVNTIAIMKHLKGSKTPGYKILTGIEKPKILFLDKQNNERDETEYCHSKYLSREDWTPYYFRNATNRRRPMMI